MRQEPITDRLYGKWPSSFVQETPKAAIAAMSSRESPRHGGADGKSYSIYMTDEEYHADRTAYNFSRLKVLLRSPMAFHHAETSQRNQVDTPARLLGKAVHLAVLQPELIESDIVVWDGRRQGYKWERFKANNEDRLILSAEQIKVVASMAASVKAYQDLDLEYMFQNGESEKVIFWQDEQTGIWLKVKLDSHFNQTDIIDLKTVGDAKQGGFIRNQAIPLHWDMQAVMYADGAGIYTGQENTVSYVAIEDEAPHHVQVHEVERGGGYWMNGQRKYRYCLDLLKYCLAHGSWPGYSESTSTLSQIPAHLEFVSPT